MDQNDNQQNNCRKCGTRQQSPEVEPHLVSPQAHPRGGAEGSGSSRPTPNFVASHQLSKQNSTAHGHNVLSGEFRVTRSHPEIPSEMPSFRNEGVLVQPEKSPLDSQDLKGLDLASK